MSNCVLCGRPIEAGHGICASCRFLLDQHHPRARLVWSKEKRHVRWDDTLRELRYGEFITPTAD